MSLLKVSMSHSHFLQKKKKKKKNNSQDYASVLTFYIYVYHHLSILALSLIKPILNWDQAWKNYNCNGQY